jgi:hypothetical protein
MLRAGTATIYKLDDGSGILRLTNFSTSNGPKVYVILADPLISGTDVGDAKSVDLGHLKGNTGNQNYVIPASVNLDDVNRRDLLRTLPRQLRCRELQVSRSPDAKRTPCI